MIFFCGCRLDLVYRLFSIVLPFLISHTYYFFQYKMTYDYISCIKSPVVALPAHSLASRSGHKSNHSFHSFFSFLFFQTELLSNIRDFFPTKKRSHQRNKHRNKKKEKHTKNTAREIWETMLPCRSAKTTRRLLLEASATI